MEKGLIGEKEFVLCFGPASAKPVTALLHVSHQRQYLNTRGRSREETKGWLENSTDEPDFLKMTQTYGKLECWYGLKVSLMALWEKVLCCTRPEMGEGGIMKRKGIWVVWRKGGDKQEEKLQKWFYGNFWKAGPCTWQRGWRWRVKGFSVVC